MATYNIQLYKGSRPIHFQELNLEEVPEGLVTKVLQHYLRQVEIDLYKGTN